MPKKIWRILAPIATAVIILLISVAIIFYGRGYRLDVQQKSVGATGLLTATSDPIGATVFINGKKQTATNANINVSPDFYTVTIAKEGYQSWEKRIRVQGEVVARADAMLFPANPSLYAITTNGASNPIFSPDGTKLAYIVPQTKESTNGGQLISREGVWVLDMADKPLGFNRDARHVLTDQILKTDNSILTWSPDSKQLLITKNPTTIPQYYLTDAEKTNDRVNALQNTIIVEAEWRELQKARETEKMLGLKEEFYAIATSSASIIAFSPDETKVLYEATRSATIPQVITPALIGTNSTEETRAIKPNTLYVYDMKEDKNYSLGDTALMLSDNPAYTTCQKETTPAAGSKTATTVGKSKQTAPVLFSVIPCKLKVLGQTIQWLASSRHLIIAGKNTIDVMEYDGLNRKTIYAGPFLDGFAAAWPNGSKIVILTNFNSGASTVPNLYAVNIR